MLWLLQSWERMSFTYVLPLNSEERLTLGLNAVVTIFLILTLSLNLCFLNEVWQDRGACRELSPGRSSPPWPGVLVTCSLTPTWRRLHSLTHPTSTPCLRVCDIKTGLVQRNIRWWPCQFLGKCLRYLVLILKCQEWWNLPCRVVGSSKRVSAGKALLTVSCTVLTSVERLGSIISRRKPSLFRKLINYVLPDSSVHGDSPGKNTRVGCHAFSRGSSQPRDWTQSPALQEDALPNEQPGKLFCLNPQIFYPLKIGS